MITPDRRKRERQGCVVRGMKEESPARWAAGAAAPAPAVRRRENLRSASFREYTMEESARQGPRPPTGGGRYAGWEREAAARRGPPPPTAGGLNVECRGHPCKRERGWRASRATAPSMIRP